MANRYFFNYPVFPFRGRVVAGMEFVERPVAAEADAKCPEGGAAFIEHKDTLAFIYNNCRNIAVF